MVTISQKDVVATVSAAGLVIRYTFFLVGALTLALIAIAMTTIWGWRARTIDAKPAFRIAAPELAKLPTRSKVILSWHGRVETRHYGQIYDRDMDLTVALIMPPKDRANITIDGLPDIPDIKPLRNRRMVSNAVNHDLETRFGPLRATDVRVDTDGRWKLCLTYYSRFATDDVVLAGWYCDASGAKPSPDRLACLLDRLVLDSPLESARGRYVHARASSACGAMFGIAGVANRRYPLAQQLWQPPVVTVDWSTPSALRFRDR